MHILLVASTLPEIEPFLKKHVSGTGTFRQHGLQITTMITGIGMHRMSFELGRAFAQGTPDLCINAGIAGTFPGKCEIGEVVQAGGELIVDLGAENAAGEVFSLEAIGLEEDISSIHDLLNPDINRIPFLRPVRAITSNTAHGSAFSIQRLIDRYDPDIESMEGAAFFYCCLKAGVPFAEIRAISNLIEVRNRDRWNIELATGNLAIALQDTIELLAASL